MWLDRPEYFKAFFADSKLFLQLFSTASKIFLYEFSTYRFYILINSHVVQAQTLFKIYNSVDSKGYSKVSYKSAQKRGEVLTKKYFHVNTLHTHYKNAHVFEKKRIKKIKNPTYRPYLKNLMSQEPRIFFFGLMNITKNHKKLRNS